VIYIKNKFFNFSIIFIITLTLLFQANLVIGAEAAAQETDEPTVFTYIAPPIFQLPTEATEQVRIGEKTKIDSFCFNQLEILDVGLQAYSMVTDKKEKLLRKQQNTC
jgi:hypothetical protein